VRDINTAVVDSLKVLDPEWPIREADIGSVISPPNSYANRDLWNSRQRGRALWHATRALFETLCFQNGLGGRRGKERNQRSSGVSLTAVGNDARGELSIVLNC
jgi:hypothetical protein